MAIQVNGTTVINNSRQLTNIASVDSATVTALGNAGVGGSNWYQSNWLTKPYGARHIVSDGSTVILSPSSGGYLHYSRDNGDTFTYTTSGFTGNDTANGAAINGNVVCIAGNWNTVKRSTDYGATWGTTFNTGNWMTCIGNSGSTFIAGGENGKVARSTDNGANWSTFQWPHGGNKIMGVDGYGSNWVLVGENGCIAYSTNNGSSFTAISTSPFAGRQLQDVKTDGNGTWITGGESGRVWFSTNNGVSWTEFKSGTSNYIQDFATDGNGNWIMSGAYGYTGHILSGTTLSSSVSFSGGIFTGAGGMESVEYGNNRWFSITQSTSYYYDM